VWLGVVVRYGVAESWIGRYLETPLVMLLRVAVPVVETAELTLNC